MGPTGLMKTWKVALALLALVAAPVHAQEEAGLEQSADRVLIGVPVLALGLTFLLDSERKAAAGAGFAASDMFLMNGSPRHDLTLALLRTGFVTYGLKAVVDAERPNGKSGSFPSGHTATTFAGAEFIRKEYGWGWGAPAYLAAAFVGWSRVETDDHWWHDVAVGAAIGVASNYDLRDLPNGWGELSVRPAMFSTGVADAPEMHQQDSDAAFGMKLELQF